MSADLFIGLMSGTSLDAIDAALLRFDETKGRAELLGTLEQAFPARLHTELNALVTQPETCETALLGRLHRELGLTYAAAVNELLRHSSHTAADVVAIGCHGQTVWHAPLDEPAFTVQLGCGATLANETGIVTVNDFRSADIACGGEGAPLAPLFHNWMFRASPRIAVANLGGIANLTVVGTPVRGFDTGPANTLLDVWFRHHHEGDFDTDGEWARSGKVSTELLRALRDEPYFLRQPPKSTGRELFNSDWLGRKLDELSTDVSPVDVQATLVELTATTLADALRTAAPEVRQLFVCGGGAANPFLLERLSAAARGVEIDTTAAAGVPPSWIEAAAFAWLARERMAGRAAGEPALTGARARAVLGAVHLPAEA